MARLSGCLKDILKIHNSTQEDCQRDEVQVLHKSLVEATLSGISFMNKSWHGGHPSKITVQPTLNVKERCVI